MNPESGVRHRVNFLNLVPESRVGKGWFHPFCMDPFDAVVESYYLETNDSLFFAVKGFEHPPDRFIAVLRYALDPDGDRRKGDVVYRRLYHSVEQEDLIRSYPQYLSFDPVFQTTLQSVPRSLIRQIHVPSIRLLQIVQAPSKPIENDIVAFSALLQSEAELPLSAIGVSGSVLISLDSESSDLDISIFGEENCQKAYKGLKRLLDSGAETGLRRLGPSEIEALYAQRVVDTPMNFEEFSESERSKTCQGMFRQRPYFIRFLKHPHEAGTRYGDLRYTPLGRATVTGMITSDKEAFYTPCRYALSGGCTLAGQKVTVKEVISFRGRFCEQAREEQVIRASGTLERVESASGEIYYRLLVGNSTQDTIGVRH